MTTLNSEMTVLGSPELGHSVHGCEFVILILVKKHSVWLILPYEVLTDGATVVQSSRTNKHNEHLPKNSSNEILLHTCMISNL